MLMLHSAGLFSRTISVRLNGHELASIKDKRFWSGANIHIEGVHYELRRTGMVSGDYVLENGGQVIARGRKPSFASRRLEADIGGWAYDLRPKQFTSRFEVESGGVVVGSIGPRPILRAFPAHLPPDMATIYQVFLVALVSVMWNRDDS